MKYFLDTEFIEWAGGIDLVSIGIVNEIGQSYYAESANFDERNADPWVKDNVLSKLKFWGNESSNKGFCNASTVFAGSSSAITEVFGTNALIRDTILDFIGDDKEPVFYAYYASYDWIVFARLFGRLIDRPEHFPMWVVDLKQMMWERNLDKIWKREHCPDPENEHNALVDAFWNKKLFEAITKNTVMITKISK